MNCVNMKKLENFKFTKVFIDEASQVLELESLLVLKHAEQLVLLGDPKQLSPFLN